MVSEGSVAIANGVTFQVTNVEPIEIVSSGQVREALLLLAADEIVSNSPTER